MQHDNMQRLFVYGTLMPGHVNHHYLQAIDGEWARASVKGRLYPEGIGLAQGYPALVLDEHADDVPGWVLTSSQLQSHWPILDEFEGFAYQRVTTMVVAQNNMPLEAYVYVLSGNENL